jgi:hypothetical protein
LSEEKTRMTPEQTIKIERIFNAKDKIPSYKIISIDDFCEQSNKKENMETKIIDILKSHKESSNESTISFDELYKRLSGEKDYNLGAVKAALKRLQGKSIIEMEKAGSWNVIRIL